MRIVNARIPDAVKPALRDNEIIAAPKGDSDIRPITPTGVLRKIASAILFSTVSTFNKNYFQQIQYALHRSGTEHIINTLRTVHELHPDRDIFAMDGDNAFNRVSRRIGLKTVLEHCPQVFPFLRMLYGEPGTVWYYGMTDCIREITNQEGYLQGDSLALWAYILTIHPFLRALQERIGCAATLMFYVDDGNIVADFDTMMTAITFIEQEGPRYGYVLKKNKGSYLLGKCNDSDTAYARKEALIRLGFDSDIIHIHPDNVQDPGKRLECDLNYGVTILGSFIGTAAYIQAHLVHKSYELLEICNELCKLPHTQTMMLLFRYCYCPMVNHLLRTISPGNMALLLKDFNLCKKRILKFILGTPDEELPSTLKRWEKLSTKMGGINTGMCVITKHTAFLASFAATRKTIKKYVPEIDDHIKTGTIPYAVDINRSLNFVKTKGGYTDDGTLESVVYATEGNAEKLQEQLTSAIQKRVYDQKLASQTLDIHEKAWIVSISQTDASMWIDAIPKTSDTTFTNEEFRCALRYRYMINQPMITPGIQCTCLRGITLDRLGHHAITGCRNNGSRQFTHDSIKHKISAMLRYACLVSREEEVGLFQGNSPDSNMRADITIEQANQYFPKRTILDVAVTCPIPGAAGTGAQLVSRAQAGIQGRKAEEMVRHKVQKYGDLSREAGLNFIPIVIESTGYIHKITQKFFKTVSECAEVVRGISKDILYKYWMTQISITLQKSLVHALRRKVILSTNKKGGPFNETSDEVIIRHDSIHV